MTRKIIASVTSFLAVEEGAQPHALLGAGEMHGRIVEKMVGCTLLASNPPCVLTQLAHADGAAAFIHALDVLRLVQLAEVRLTLHPFSDRGYGKTSKGLQLIENFVIGATTYFCRHWSPCSCSDPGADQRLPPRLTPRCAS